MEAEQKSPAGTAQFRQERREQQQQIEVQRSGRQ